MCRELGQLRHIETSQFWIQDRAAREEVGLEKIDGRINQADFLTKLGDRESLIFHTAGVRLTRMVGRHAIAPMA